MCNTGVVRRAPVRLGCHRGDRDKTYLGGTLLLLPHQTFHVMTKTFMEHEVFRTSVRHVGLVTDVLGFAAVLPTKDYVRGRPRGFDAADVWVCDARYNDVSKSFDRIRMFPRAFPEPRLEPLPALEPFPDGPRKVVSVRSPHWTAPKAADTGANGAASGTTIGAAAALLVGLASGASAGGSRPSSGVLRIQASPSLLGAGTAVGGSSSARPGASASPRQHLTPSGQSPSGSSLQLPVTRAVQGTVVSTSLGPVPVQILREPNLPAIRSLLLNQVGVVQRLSDGYLHLSQLLRGLVIPPDRYRVLYDLVAATAAPLPSALDARMQQEMQRNQLPFTVGPWFVWGSALPFPRTRPPPRAAAGRPCYLTTGCLGTRASQPARRGRVVVVAVDAVCVCVCVRANLQGSIPRWCGARLWAARCSRRTSGVASRSSFRCWT